MKVCLVMLILSSLVGSGRSSALPRAPLVAWSPSTVHQEYRIEAPRIRLTQSVLATTVPTDTEALMIALVVDRHCPATPGLGAPTISITPPRYAFSCPVAAGHSIGGTIERFVDLAAAQAAFQTARGSQPLESFHGYAAYSRQVQSTPPFTEKQHAFQADRWVVSTTAIDDTPYSSGPPSEAMYQAAARDCLFPGQYCLLFVTLIQHQAS
jgi:hypothetical protein